ncbi:methyltransferase domain-containing protein [Candidatus Pristimantibacillus sp. PTI5]|uniref:methyltransferase domain-containing protein n=1 Tax=Candidatus Pristimantibacillus sp. PTI5 TaxID=3400422 RepID=UPI003B011DD8
MNSSIINMLQCPVCSSPFTGQFTCPQGHRFQINDGIPNLFYQEANTVTDTEAEPEDYSFSSERLQRLAEMEKWHFWFKGRQQLLNRLIKTSFSKPNRFVLDIGCGTGLMSEQLVHLGHHVVGIDQRPEGLRAVQKKVPELMGMQANAMHLPFKDHTFDAVLLLDVLEHVDENALLSELNRVVRQGGIVVITVPAFPWLWSYRDEAAGHLRRYTRKHLIHSLSEANFEIEKLQYYQFLLFPLVLLTRLLGRNSAQVSELEEKPSLILNKIMTLITRMEVTLSKNISWPWGSSLIAICRRKN